MTLNTLLARTVESSSRNSYLELLDAAWAAHLKPRANNALTVISTFAGAGGSSLGYSMAGYRELLAVEWDDNAVETFQLNFPDVPVYHGDIAKLSVEQCLEMTGLQPGELDMLDGSPPCQGFSTAGKRILDDPRNQLFREYVRLLQGLQPRAFVMENVSGMVKGKMKLVFADILRELKACGYRVKAAKLNAMYFHVPQSRERMIFIGIRDDLGIEPGFPKGQSRPIAAGEAIKDVSNPPSEIEFLLAAGQRYRAYKYWASIPIGQSEAKLTGQGMNAVKFTPDRPARTIRNNDGNLTMYGAMHWSEHRRFTEAEFKRFSSFPDSFIFAQSKRWGSSINRIGNSVPPLFMRAIAEHVQQLLVGTD